jgi:mono/diheme cytochrome c family protein
MIRIRRLGLGLTLATVAVPLVTAVAPGQQPPPAPPASSAAPPAGGAAAGDPAAGEQIFVNPCGFCHQDGGRVAGRGPKLAGTDRPDDYLVNRIRTGKEGAMPAYGRAFTEAQVRSLVAYIRSLKADGQ